MTSDLKQLAKGNKDIKTDLKLAICHKDMTSDLK